MQTAELERATFIVSREHASDLSRLGIRINAGTHTVHRDVVIWPPVSLFGGFFAPNPLTIGPFSYSWSAINPRVAEIGRYCSIAENVTLTAVEHPTDWISTSNFTYSSEFWRDFLRERGTQFSNRSPDYSQSRMQRLVIGNDVWIGTRAFVRAGCRIGHGTVIAAGAVVVKDTPPYSIIAGNPGVVKKLRFSDRIIERLIQANWWDYAFDAFENFDIKNINVFLDQIDNARINGSIAKYSPEPIRLFNTLLNLGVPIK
ncbi:acetyltransferase-like isoleucine patch superfamily enzyme [Rhodoblastus acidophilus]|uniref:CatB-related O-acetyltransferase n=1 Tax=Rhodoblastus acidophilus TaxID=1074 RepID=UPI0022244092|nr:CatB-related O-acetyltransferase [Rhodoblastus acidophilus]MCW2316595.1 acetyltransferase-like isoleucine patch superfamily enzyme [Rhodoblastus acidophilus]